MDLQNLAYALTQVVHNFGAVAVAGGAVYGRSLPDSALDARYRVAWMILIAWSTQAVSGLGFGAISYAYYGQFPDIHGIAIAALFIKMACAAAGIALAIALLRYRARGPDGLQPAAWTGEVFLGITALAAAAFLRWFA